MECGDSSPLFGEGFSLHNRAIGPAGTRVTVREAPDPPIHTMEGPACQVRLLGLGRTGCSTQNWSSQWSLVGAIHESSRPIIRHELVVPDIPIQQS